MREHRETVVRIDDRALTIDVRCDLTAADHDIAIGPTRHAWFNYRVAPSMCVDEGGRLQDDRGHAGRATSMDEHARWVDATGPVGAGRRAGVALLPDADHDWWWFVTDWGVVTASPCRDHAIELSAGAAASLAARYVVHDGIDDAALLTRTLAA